MEEDPEEEIEESSTQVSFQVDKSAPILDYGSEGSVKNSPFMEVINELQGNDVMRKVRKENLVLKLKLNYRIEKIVEVKSR